MTALTEALTRLLARKQYHGHCSGLPFETDEGDWNGTIRKLMTELVGDSKFLAARDRPYGERELRKALVESGRSLHDAGILVAVVGQKVKLEKAGQSADTAIPRN
jgi:hypothetical protein